MHIWTDEPQKELWRQLRYLASPSNVYAILTGKTKSHRDVQFDESEETRSRAYEIASCVRQSDEYQIASSDVGLVTQPLLDFYSCQALSKAIILASKKDIRLENLNYHGLSTRASSIADENERERFQVYCEDKSLWKIETEYAVTNDGVFRYLCMIYDDYIVENGISVIFDDILRNTPELANIYQRHYGKTSCSFYLSSVPSLDRSGRLKILFSQDVDFEDVTSVFPRLQDDFERIDNHNGFISKDAFEKVPDWVQGQNGAIAGMYLTKGLSCGINRSASILFAGLFVLSNVVRYKPDFWMKEVEGERSGSASIVEAFCTLARRKLPKVLLEKFWKEVFTFGSPGYFV